MSHRGNLDFNPVVVRVVVRSHGGARAKIFRVGARLECPGLELLACNLLRVIPANLISETVNDAFSPAT